MSLPLIFIPLALFWVAWTVRGRIVGDHPTCGRCGFDLYGRPKDSMHCPECGAVVMRYGAILFGRRERSPWLVAASVGVLLGLFAWTGADLYQQAKPDRVARYKPAWWLRWDAKSGMYGSVALAELAARARAGELGRAQLKDLVAHALALQGDRETAWDQAWGTFVEDLRAAGVVSNEEWNQYAQQSVRFEKRESNGGIRFAEPREPLGDTLDGAVTLWPRAGARTPLRVAVQSWLRAGDRELAISADIGNSFAPRSSPIDDWWRVRLPIDLIASLPPGRQNSMLTFDITITDASVGGAQLATLRQSVPLSWTFTAEYRDRMQNAYGQNVGTGGVSPAAGLRPSKEPNALKR